MNYLITGGAGFIGSTLANHLFRLGHRVTVVDDLSMGKKENLTSGVHFIKASVTNQEFMTTLLKDDCYDYIFHLAAIASVADSVERPIETHQVNFDSVLSLLELTKKFQPKLKRLIFSSSAAIYGDEPTLPKKEESVIRPLTPYAIDKFSAEQYVLTYCRLYKVPTSVVRFFNVYGPNQNPESPYSGVISILVDQYKKIIAGKPSSFQMFGDGEQSRDFIYVEDVIQALLLVADNPSALGQQFNVGTGTAISLNQLIQTINQILKTELPVSYKKKRDGDIEISLADNQKLKKLGFSSNFSLLEGITQYLKSEGLCQ